MLTTIKKRDGSEVPFDAQKIFGAIFKANNVVHEKELMSGTDISFVTNKVVDYVHKNNVTTVEDIQDVVEKMLIKSDFSETAKEYILYRAEHNKIRNSESYLMDIYKNLTYVDAADDDIQRENANIDGNTAMGTMLKYGSEGSKYFIDNYILPKDISLAHADGQIHIHDKDFYMLTETCCQMDLLKLFKNGFNTGHGYIREPNSIESYAALACVAIQSNQNEMHGGQSIPNFDYSMAPGVSKTYWKEFKRAAVTYLNIKGYDEFAEDHVQDAFDSTGIYSPFKISEADDTLDKFIQVSTVDDHLTLKFDAITVQIEDIVHAFSYAREEALKRTDIRCHQAMELLIHNLCTMSSRSGAQVPFSSLNYGTDTSEEGRMIIKNLLLATDEGLGNGETPIFPVQIFKLKSGVNYNPEDPNYDLFKLAIKTSAKRLFPNFSNLESSFNAPYYDGTYNSEVSYMGCVVPWSNVTYKIGNSNSFITDIAELYETTRDFFGNIKRSDTSDYVDTSDRNVIINDTLSGGLTNVKKVIRNYYHGDMYRIRFANGRVQELTPDHPLPVLGRGRIRADELVVGDTVPLGRFSTPIVENSNITDPDYAWLLGVILCDGNYNNNIVVSLGLDELDIVNKIKYVCEKYGFSINVTHQSRDDKGFYYDVNIKCGSELKIFRDELRKQFRGVLKSERKIPKCIMTSSMEIKSAFLAGMIDADGYYYNNKSTVYSLGSTSGYLAFSQYALIESMQLNPKMHTNRYSKFSPNLRYVNDFDSCELINSHLAASKKIITDTKYVRSTPIGDSVSINSIEIVSYSGYVYDVETVSDTFDVNGMCSHNCRTRVMGNVHDPKQEITSGRGNLSFTTVNLPRIAIETMSQGCSLDTVTTHRSNDGQLETHPVHGSARKEIEDKFFSILDERISMVFRQLIHRLKIQSAKKVKNYPFLMGEGIWLDSDKLTLDDTIGEVLRHGTLTIGFIGLAETLKCLIGNHHGESEEAQELGLRIVGHMRKRCDEESEKTKLNFSLIATPAESLSGRFVAIDKKKYGIMEGVTDREYYTNSSHK